MENVDKKSTNEKSLSSRLQTVLKKKRMQLMVLAYVVFCTATCPLFVVSAVTAASTGDSGFTSVLDFVMGWVRNLGIGVLLWGAVEFFNGFRADDAEGKTKGIRFTVSGAGLMAVGIAGVSLIK